MAESDSPGEVAISAQCADNGIHLPHGILQHPGCFGGSLQKVDCSIKKLLKSQDFRSLHVLFDDFSAFSDSALTVQCGLEMIRRHLLLEIAGGNTDFPGECLVEVTVVIVATSLTDGLEGNTLNDQCLRMDNAAFCDIAIERLAQFFAEQLLHSGRTDKELFGSGGEGDGGCVIFVDIG